MSFFNDLFYGIVFFVHKKALPMNTLQLWNSFIIHLWSDCNLFLHSRDQPLTVFTVFSAFYATQYFRMFLERRIIQILWHIVHLFKYKWKCVLCIFLLITKKHAVDNAWWENGSEEAEIWLEPWGLKHYNSILQSSKALHTEKNYKQAVLDHVLSTSYMTRFLQHKSCQST